MDQINDSRLTQTEGGGVTIAVIRELDRLFLIAKTTGAVSDWIVYFEAKSRVDRLAKIAS